MASSAGLRIVFVAPFGLRHKSTVWARTLPLARELNRLGHTASILVPPWDSPHDSGILVVRDGVRLEHVAVEGGLAATVTRLVRSVLEDEPDVVHIVKPRAHAGIVQWLLWQARRTGVAVPRMVLDVDDWEEPWAAINGYPGYQARFLAWQERWGIRHAEAITAASRWLYDRAGILSPKAQRLYLPNGIDEERRSAPRDFGLRMPPRVLLFSRFMEVSPTWLGDMWRTLRREAPAAVLILAGKALHSGGVAPYLDALSAGNGDAQNPNVVWRGYVNPRDLADLYADVDCAIFPSDDTDLHRAKCSVRMATALQWSVPTVASAVGEQASYGADGAARLVPAGASPSEFARAVAEVLCDSSMRQDLGTQAAARMQGVYDWHTLAESLSRFYRRATPDA